MIMAKTVDNVITVKLSAALKRAAEAYGAAEGKRRILERLESRELRAFGFRKNSNELILIPVEFWQDKPVDDPIRSEAYGCRSYYQVHINWDEGSAWREDGDEAYYGIQLAREGFDQLLPPGSIGASPVGKDAMQPKDWLTAEVARIKVTREIDPRTKTELAQSLEGRIEAAARRGEVTKPVGYRHIVNNLGAWGLWPISSVQ
jgi:hypothetical protein